MFRLPLAVAAAVLGLQSNTMTGAISVSVLDRSGAMVADLRAEEVSVKENGQARVVRRIERDERPLALAVLVDASEVGGKGFLRDLADPTMDFITGLPPGVQPTLMTIGTPPEQIPLDDPAKARETLRTKLPFGKLSLYDGIADASERLRSRNGMRRAMIVVLSDRHSEEDRDKAMSAVARSAPIVFAIQFQGAGTFPPGLDTIVQWTGGRFEQIGSTTGVAATLKKLLPELAAPWLVIYETQRDLADRKIEVKVARKGVKARFRAAMLEQAQ